MHLVPFCSWCVAFFDFVAYFVSSGLGVGLRPTLLAAMALERPRLGEEPDPGTCNALHIHLVEYACEELWSLAADSDDENAETYDEQAEQLMCAGGTPCNRDLFEWLKDKMPAPAYEKVLQEAARVGWPFLPVPAEGVLPVSAGGEQKAQHPACEPMSEHQHWRQLRDVIQDGMRIAQGGGKLRRITA